MPARIARSSVQTTAPTNVRNKARKRHLDAYSIASHSAPEKAAVKRHRLGEYLDDTPRNKRRRTDLQGSGDDESVEEEDFATSRFKRKRTSGAGDDDIEEGSDSSGNEWTLGGLGEDDEDSELDSDEAFGDSDDERYEGFTFRGSSSANSRSKRKTKNALGSKKQSDGGIDLDEEDEDVLDDEEDDFGEEGVDLATVLDDDVSDETESVTRNMPDAGESGSESDDKRSNLEATSEDEESEDNGQADIERMARLRDRIEALDNQQTPAEQSEPTPIAALTVDDLLADLDPDSRKQFAAAIKTRKRSERPRTLAAPLPKRQQDRADREVASQKAKEQLDRWRDTVMHNRRAEFLSFPLRDDDVAAPIGKDQFVPSKPQNELEESIQRIMEESGMASANRNADDDHVEDAILKSEDLATKKLPIEEVEQRRAELRRTRDLLFREEIKAKRIAKIKSKSYRRVHRKEKERMAEREREERKLLGLEEDEDGKNSADRKRAEERMNTKHRDSKWAKSLKATSRTVWDHGARDSVNEEARRRAELKRRIEGRDVESGDESDISGGEHDDDRSEDEGAFGALKRLDKVTTADDVLAGNGLTNMKFMRAADAKRRAQNDEDAERLRKELAIEDGDESETSEIDDQGLGRAIFGPKGKEGANPTKQQTVRPELEEGEADEGDEADADEQQVSIVTGKIDDSRQRRKKSSAERPLAKGADLSRQTGDHSIEGAVSSWLTAPVKTSNRDRRHARAATDDAYIDIKLDTGKKQIAAVDKSRIPAVSKNHHNQEVNAEAAAQDVKGGTLVKHDEEQVSDSEQTETPILTAEQQKAEYYRRAFAGDDVKAHFDAEKASLASSEDEKETSSYIPGWGSWTGAGLTKSVKRANARQKHNPLFKSKSSGGVKIADRKDAKLDNVIVSEKQDRKGKKYLAPVLPHGFERKDQYERSLRLPVGPEWTTKEVFQRATRPRVVVKPGAVIEAMERPLV